MPNPLIAQGSLNRLKASLTWQAFPQLNVIPPFLGKGGISMRLEGDATTYLPTMTGAVTSGEPYAMAVITVHLLKTQALAALYKAQIETQTVLGDCVVRPDSLAHPPYDFTNCSLQLPNDLDFSGQNPEYVATVRGVYLLNSDLWN